MPTAAELRRIVPFTLLLFCLCIAYNMLRAMKDVVTLTTYECGTEVIPFLKVWGILPASVIVASLFAWLSQRIKRETIFYLFLSTFVAYYLVFAHYLYPNLEDLRLEKLGVSLSYRLPAGFSGLIAMIVNWPATLFYMASELWATMLVAVLFWGFANQSFNSEEASRSYGFLKIGATSSALCAGALAGWLTKSPSGNGWETTFLKEIHAITLLAFCCMGIFAYLQRNVIPQTEVPQASAHKQRQGIVHSLRIVMADKRLLYLAVLVLGYNMTYNCVDILWKAQLRLAYPDPNDLMYFISKLTAAVGAIAVIAAMSSGWIVRRLGWTALAMTTPAVMLVLCISFFSALFFGKSDGMALATVVSAAPVALLVSIGATQNALSKACKYSVFDISKEIAFSSLDSETQWNGKTAIDGIGNDVGKTGASLTQQAFLLSFGNLAVATPWLAAVVFAVLFTWIYAVTRLSRARRLIEEPATT